MKGQKAVVNHAVQNNIAEFVAKGNKSLSMSRKRTTKYGNLAFTNKSRPKSGKNPAFEIGYLCCMTQGSMQVTGYKMIYLLL